MPALTGHGYVSDEDQVKELYKILGTAPETREIYELIRNRKQIPGETTRMMGAQGRNQALSTLNQYDPEAVTSGFSTAFKDLLGALGSPLMANSIPTIRGLTTAMNEFSAVAGKHKEEVTVVTSGLAGAIGGAVLGAGGGFLVAGPAGVIPGAIYGAGGGGALATAYGFMASQEGGHHQTAYDRRQERLKRNGVPTDESPGLSGWNVVPPPAVKQTIQVTSNMIVDGRTLAQVVTNHQVQDGNGPAQGSPYPDTTRGGSSFDFVLVN